MVPRLILIEGLPGGGKTRTARIVTETLHDMGFPTRTFFEGNPFHPADFEGTAAYTPPDFARLLRENPDLEDVIWKKAESRNAYHLVYYAQWKEDDPQGFPEELLPDFQARDIYELPFTQNRELVCCRWNDFCRKAKKEDNIYIFECCFIQNPVTVGKIKYNLQREEVLDYVLTLAKIVEELNPLLIYLDQEDVDLTFRRALEERPPGWREMFIKYYTGQGYGRENGLKGIDGTIKVLQARRRLEREIYDRLPIHKFKINNSSFEPDRLEKAVGSIINLFYVEGI